jgi:uncharacterized protein (TIGR00266 family)
MQHEILYQPSYSAARIRLEQGERIMAESGAMVSMSPTIHLDAQVSGGGIFGALKSAIGGESLFRTTFTAESGPGEVLLAPTSVGDIMAVELTGGTMMVQGGSYLAGDVDLAIDIAASGKAFFAGEGLFLLSISGSGLLLLSSFGAIHKVTLGPGEEYVADTTHMVAFDASVQYAVQKATGASSGIGGFLKGAVKSALSGEGLVCRYTGPGELYLQTRSVSGFVQFLVPFLPKPSGN